MARKFSVPLSCFVLFCCVLTGVRGYPNGAPENACGSVEVGAPHTQYGAIQPQQGWSPYALHFQGGEEPVFWPGMPLRGELRGKEFQRFKGFMIRAYDEKGNSFGTFEALSNRSKGLNCDGASPSALTHSDRMVKTSVVFDWHPPAWSESGHVYFKAAVVESTHVFWLDVSGIVHSGEHRAGPGGSPNGGGRSASELTVLLTGILTGIIAAMFGF